MPLSPEEVHARVVGRVGPDGRLPMPPVAEGDVMLPPEDGWRADPEYVADRTADHDGVSLI